MHKNTWLCNRWPWNKTCNNFSVFSLREYFLIHPSWIIISCSKKNDLIKLWLILYSCISEVHCTHLNSFHDLLRASSSAICVAIYNCDLTITFFKKNFILLRRCRIRNYLLLVVEWQIRNILNMEEIPNALIFKFLSHSLPSFLTKSSMNCHILLSISN